MKSTVGKVTDDPAATLPVGSKIEFEPSVFPLGSPPGEHTIINWEHFEGVLLHLIIADRDRVYVHGSAVLVSMGVALAARHVIQPFLDMLTQGAATVTCGSIGASQLMLWQGRDITLVGNDSDLAIIILSYSSDLSPENLFKMAAITTRMPDIGEPVTMVGFTASDPEFHRQEMGFTGYGDVRASVGIVTDMYPNGRDRVLMPGPALAVGSYTSGGMSGGPVFDRHGLLIGLVGTCMTSDDPNGPSSVSLLWPALTTPISARWPNGVHVANRPLCEFGKLCCIDRVDAIERINETEFAYTPWSKNSS